MKIKRKSWLSRFSNWGRRKYDMKYNDTLCAYFWRIVLKLVIVAFMASYAYFLGTIFYTNPEAIVLILFFICAVAFPILVIRFIRSKLGKSPETPYENIVVEYIKARKEKVCPIIEYVD